MRTVLLLKALIKERANQPDYDGSFYKKFYFRVCPKCGCRNNYRYRYYQTHKAQILLNNAIRYENDGLTELSKNLIEKVGKCADCGSTELKTLVLHHNSYLVGKNGKERKGRMGRWDIVNGNVSYKILCRNCHHLQHLRLE
jgi:hypothetical protein